MISIFQNITKGILVLILFCAWASGKVVNAQVLQTFQGHEEEVNAVSFSPDGKQLYTGSGRSGRDRRAIVWDIATGKMIRSFSIATAGYIYGTVFSLDGRYVASRGNNKINLYDMSTGRVVQTLPDSRRVFEIAFSRDGKYLITGDHPDISGDNNGYVKIWDVATGREIRALKGKRDGTSSVAMSPDNRYVATAEWLFNRGSKKHSAKLYDVSRGREIRTFGGGYSAPVVFSPDGKYIMTGGAKMKLWDVSSGNLIRTFDQVEIRNIAFSPDWRFVMAVGSKGPGSSTSQGTLWEVSTGRKIRTLSLSFTSPLAFSENGQYIATSYRSYGSKPYGSQILALSYKTLIADLVREKVERWQQKGMFETTKDYQNRVTEANRGPLIAQYTQQVVDSLAGNQASPTIKNHNYDADNQTFKLTLSDGQTIFVNVPLKEARSFDANISSLQFTRPSYTLNEQEQFVLNEAYLYNPEIRKTYHYDSGRRLTFNTAELALNFDPIKVNIQTQNTGTNVQTGTTKIEVGKSDVDVNIPETALSNPDAIAVVIGNSSYEGDVPSVDFAVNDAKIVREYLVKTFGFKPGNILYEENATRNAMVVLFGNEREQGKLANYLKPGQSDVFVFYSGHGAPDPNTKTGYLMPVDADPTALSLTGYPLDILYDNLAKLPARSVQVVIDACFSGASGDGGMLIQNASPIGIQITNPAAQLKNGFVVTASSGSQVASWYPEKGHGLLTYFWLKGVQGAADSNGNKQITSAELKQFLSDPTEGVAYWARRLHNRDQTPEVFSGNPAKVIVRY